jgi:hypothetical protein
MALSVSLTGDWLSSLGNRRSSQGVITFDSSYATGGEALTPANVGLGTIDRIDFNQGEDGYVLRYDYTNEKVLVYRSAAYSPVFTGTAPTGTALAVVDDDSAASNGVIVYLHVDEVMEQGSYLGHLEFVSPTDVDGVGTISNGGPQYRIQDDDAAASGGLQVYFDEDGTNADERLLANITQAEDVFVMLSNGEMLRINHDASAASNGVALYFDEDGANTYERLLFVSPTDTVGAGAADDTVTMKVTTPAGTIGALSAGVLAEVGAAVDLSLVVTEFYAIGR